MFKQLGQRGEVLVLGSNVKKKEPNQSGADRAPLTEEYLQEHTVGELTPLASPIRVVDYDPEWPRRFELEANKIRSALGDSALLVEHVGSTAVPDLPAKPIIDIVLLVTDAAREAEYLPGLELTGYRLRIREAEWHEHRMLNSLDPDVNLHVFSNGCAEVRRMLEFRDWLRFNTRDRELYARSKRELAQRDWKYVQNYADAKTGVIAEIISRMQRAQRRILEPD